jgi:hypothetical protein
MHGGEVPWTTWRLPHVSPVPAGKQLAEAERLAAACIRDAAEEDISEEELTDIAIEDSDGDDLVAYMVKALEKAELEELDDLIGDDEEADA